MLRAGPRDDVELEELLAELHEALPVDAEVLDGGDEGRRDAEAEDAVGEPEEDVGKARLRDDVPEADSRQRDDDEVEGVRVGPVVGVGVAEHADGDDDEEEEEERANVHVCADADDARGVDVRDDVHHCAELVAVEGAAQVAVELAVDAPQLGLGEAEVHLRGARDKLVLGERACAAKG